MSRGALRLTMLAGCALIAADIAHPTPAVAQTLPTGFKDELLFSTGPSPASLRFAPDGRMFIGRRIEGKLMVARFDAAAKRWVVQAQPFYTFDVPKNASGTPTAHRSSGLRDVAFDPAFATNGYVYAFYMKNNPRHNRVVRLRRSTANPDRAEAGSETLLMQLPFNASQSSGSHNGGALSFGSDGKLYVTTGDGWTGGDQVQRLTTFTGKVLRVNGDGTIPTDNPFYTTATGAYRSIYALGTRNPFSMSKNPADGKLYINETTGSNKGDIFIVAKGANYGHQGYGGIGTAASAWTNASAGGARLTTGGAWYANPFSFTIPLPFPAQYHGSYFVAMWGANSGAPGHITRIPSVTSRSPVAFASSVGTSTGGSVLKPILTRVGPDGHLYYLLTTYLTGAGQVRRVRWAGSASVAPPTISPPSGNVKAAVSVTLATTTPGATITYTIDGSAPTASSTRYATPFTLPFDLGRTVTVRALATAAGIDPSSISQGQFTFVNNTPPVVLAGPDVTAVVNTLVTLNGSATNDPDGNDDALAENWVQVSGPTISPFDGGDFVSFFTPTQVGTYVFRLTASDGVDARSDDVTIRVVGCIDDVLSGLTARWLFDESSGARALDSSPGAVNGLIAGAARTTTNTINAASRGALDFDGVDDAVQIAKGLDPSGGAVSVSAWFKADDFDVMDARLLSKASGSADADHYVMVSTIKKGSDHRLRFRVKAGGTTATLIASSGNLSTGVWTHVIATYDGAQMRLYKDGTLVGSLAKTGVLATNPAVATAIGNQPAAASGGSRAFDGVIDGVRVYGRALTASEVTTLSARATVGTVPARCTTAVDVSVKSYTATVSGSTVTVAGEICAAGVTAPTSFNVQLWLSRNAAPGCTSADADAAAVVTFPASGCESFTVPVPGWTEGTFTSYLRVDGDCKLAETDETNNIGRATFTTRADLYVKRFAATPTAGAVTLTGELCNRGAGTNGDFTVSLWEGLAAAPTCTTGGTPGQVTLRLAPGACFPFDTGAIAAPSGNYRLDLLVDAACIVAESNETNNTSTALFTIP